MFNKLVEEAIKGNKEFTEEIINRLQPLIISSIRKYYNKVNEYDDLIQEGNLIILESLKAFDPSRGVHFLGYIKLNLKYLYLNKHKRKIHLSLNESVEDGEVEAIDLLESKDKGAIDILLEDERNLELNMALERLTERQKEVILLFYMENMSIEDIGKKLGITYRTVVNLKTKALENLRKRIR